MQNRQNIENWHIFNSWKLIENWNKWIAEIKNKCSYDSKEMWRKWNEKKNKNFFPFFDSIDVKNSIESKKEKKLGLKIKSNACYLSFCVRKHNFDKATQLWRKSKINYFKSKSECYFQLMLWKKELKIWDW